MARTSQVLRQGSNASDAVPFVHRILRVLRPGGAPLKVAANELLKVLVGALTVDKKKYPVATYSCLLKKELRSLAHDEVS